MEGEIADAAVQQRKLHCFTQADVDAVLYGYLRAHADSDMPLHSISGIKFIPYQYPQGMVFLLAFTPFYYRVIMLIHPFSNSRFLKQK